MLPDLNAFAKREEGRIVEAMAEAKGHAAVRAG
jgi:hypothetical protein